MAIASLVLGVVSTIASFFPYALNGYMWIIGAVLGIVGIVLAAISIKKQQNKGIAVAGLVLSIVGLALNVIFVLACVSCAAAVSSAARSM